MLPDMHFLTVLVYVVVFDKKNITIKNNNRECVPGINVWDLGL